MSETRNIVVLGASWGGLSFAHYYLKHIHSLAKAATPNVTYKLVLVDPSTHFFWRVGAPRTLVDVKALPQDQMFTPIAKCLKPYPVDAYTIIQAEATAVDPSARTVTVSSKASGQTETIPYYSLIIATGTKSPTPLTGLDGDYTHTLHAMEEMNKRLAKATDIIIAGGGPVAVETAGEIGERFNASGKKVNITIITANDKILPVLRPALSAKAEKLLNKFGVTVLYKTRVMKAESASSGTKQANENGTGFGPPGSMDGRTTVHLDNGKTMTADVYIPATGVTPNTSFLPETLVDSTGYVKTNKSTLRVDDAGPRVYCIGDVGNYSRGGILDCYAAIPCLAINMTNDLALGFANASEHTGPSKKDKIFTPDTSETQVVPVGRKGGVGAFNGWKLPGFAISMAKGKDYMIARRLEVTEGLKFKNASG